MHSLIYHHTAKLREAPTAAEDHRTYVPRKQGFAERSAAMPAVPTTRALITANRIQGLTSTGPEDTVTRRSE
jgi:hypothetical protein